MSIEIRNEQPGDERQIEEVVCRAFREMDEANLVEVIQAYHPGFDRKYSIAAWAGTLQPYLDALEAGERLPGFCLWPLWLMAC